MSVLPDKATFLRILSLVWLISLVVVPVGLFVWLVFFTDAFVVHAISVVDGQDHTRAQVEEIVAGELQDRGVSNMFFVPVRILEQRVLAGVPQLRTVHIERQLPGTVRVVLQEKEPALLLVSQGTYYFVDEQGVAYEEARLENLPGIVLPIVKNRDENARVSLGVQSVDENFISFLDEVFQSFSENSEGEPGVGKRVTGGHTVAEIRIPSLAAREVYLLLSNNWEIRFDVTRPAKNQIIIFQYLLENTIPEEEKSSIKYIDLRIPNRVYYRAGTDTD